MKVTRFTLRAFAAGAMLAASVAAYPQGGDSLRVESALATKYTGFAGSQQNALALVGGLRSGSQITLQPAGTSCALPPPVITPPGGGPILPPGGTLPPPPVPPASFAPPTGDMGYGNVDIALNLGQQQLVNAGIDKPTPSQIQATLLGGSVRSCAGVTTMLQGILVLRASNQGWGDIASQLGLTVQASK